MSTSLRLRCPSCEGSLQLAATDRYECNACSSAFPIIDGIPSIAPKSVSDVRVSAFFDQVAKRLHEGKLSYVPFEAPQLDRQLQILSAAFVRALIRWVPAGSSMLDVGCGHGALLSDVVRTYRIAGVDVIYDMLPLARQRGYDVFHGDAAMLPFDDAQFDAVVCAEVLQHFHDLSAVLKELGRVCKPGGAVIVSTLNRHSVARWAARSLSRLMRPQAFPLPILRRSASEVESAAAECSLEEQEVAWVLSPSQSVACSPSTRALWAPLATNFIIRFRNAPKG